MTSSIAPGLDGLVPQWPVPASVRALCTTRLGGVSLPPFDGFNLAAHVGDRADHYLHNRSLLQEAIGARPVYLEQNHGISCLELTPETPDGQTADAASTQARGLACAVMVADCLPVLLCDSAGTTVAAAHAGWRGLAGNHGKGILEQTIRCFMPLAPVKYSFGATEVIAWLGPCIGPDAFEVGDEVVQAFVANDPAALACFEPVATGKWLANLPALARQRLARLGVTQVYGNDGSAPWCTVGNPLRFFSYRRDRLCGRQAAVIWLE